VGISKVEGAARDEILATQIGSVTVNATGVSTFFGKNGEGGLGEVWRVHCYRRLVALGMGGRYGMESGRCVESTSRS